MGSFPGRVLAWAMYEGVRVFDTALPMPVRLGRPLPAADRGRRDRDPVILVSGYANNPQGWGEWRRSLQADGFEVFVMDLTLNGLGDMHLAARELAAFVQDVRRRTGRARVDLVGFSEGGLLARMYVAQLGGAQAVDTVVTLATPNNGLAVGPLEDIARGVGLLRDALPESTWQLIRGSKLLVDLEAADAALRCQGPVRYVSIFSRMWDLLVTPRAAHLQGASNVAVGHDSSWLPGGPDHFSMYHYSDKAYEAAREHLLLAEGHAANSARRGTSALSG